MTPDNVSQVSVYASIFQFTKIVKNNLGVNELQQTHHNKVSSR